jgi:hypothetical protein
MKRIDYGKVYSVNGACANQAEGHFFRLCCAEKGRHHHIAGLYLGQRAREKTPRERARKGALWRL